MARRRSLLDVPDPQDLIRQAPGGDAIFSAADVPPQWSPGGNPDFDESNVGGDEQSPPPVYPPYTLYPRSDRGGDMGYLQGEDIVEGDQPELPPLPPLSQPGSGPGADAVSGGIAPVPPVLGPAPPGFDATKWANPEWQTDKYKAGRLTAGGASSADVVAALGEGWTRLSDDKIKAPDGSVFDLYFDYGGPQQRPQWTYIGGGPGDQGTGGGGAIPPPGPGGGAGVGGVGGGASGQAGGNVGGDPLSQLLTGGLGSLILGGGSTPFGQDVNSALAQVINEAGGSGDLLSRFENAREVEHKAFRSLMSDARSELANRGLLGLPGQPSGAEAGTIGRIAQSVAPEFARGAREAFVESQEQAQERLMQGLGLATQSAQGGAGTMLGAVQAGTGYQQMLGDLALGTLDRNITWNKFLAEYGLNRELVAETIRRGRVQDVKDLMELFQKFVEQSRGGYVRPTEQ